MSEKLEQDQHTFGRRLRAAGISFEDRQDLLGHRSGRITTHYSSAELNNLHDAANKICEAHKSGLSVARLRHINPVGMSADQQDEEANICNILSAGPVKVPHGLYRSECSLG